MILYVEELKAVTLVQNFTVTRRTQVERIRLHLCKYLAPTGTFTLTVKDGDGNAVATSAQTLDQMVMADATIGSEDYYHGHVSFTFTRYPNLKPGEYTLELSSTGYTYAEDEFIGWCKAWEDPTIALTDDDSPVPANEAYDYEIYEVARVR